ncbi:hypothetical protein TTHERM_00675510 (macronuclear) [Tetrahymena thermophila SB210]|uniref:Transmembrane protein n=1 Tax=Tetrahymena thermophila (strain SB210) TaxID=312017 RepID=Q23E09_TETTS|nr:hypothetical protein TTHERM_00675510 [Tetrahymena thermophila SB210]EAR94778.1 hypothetical protein TTHERM_00675510 [Tetrahymena thermophila SB210]|eukprot:XP_001015023.1 hypothetical protein TTHERM_00675510 [Tetrahymena thermophila SB210]
MKSQLLVAFAIQLLLLVNADDNCNFTIDQLNNQVLKTKISSSCNNCFTSDVKLTIQSNTQQIISLKLTAIDASDPVQQTTLKPAEKSLTINPFFLIQYQSGGTYEAFNFMTTCQTKQINGNLVYNLVFNAKVNDNYQFFELNNGYTTNSLILQSLSYVALVLGVALLF